MLLALINDSCVWLKSVAFIKERGATVPPRCQMYALIFVKEVVFSKSVNKIPIRDMKLFWSVLKSDTSSFLEHGVAAQTQQTPLQSNHL